MFDCAFTYAKRLFAVVIAAFVVASCQAPKPPVSPGKNIRFPPWVITTFHADTAFNDVDHEIISEAMQELYEQTSGILKFNVVYDLDFGSTQSIVQLQHENMLVSIKSDMKLVVEQDSQLDRGR